MKLLALVKEPASIARLLTLRAQCGRLRSTMIATDGHPHTFNGSWDIRYFDYGAATRGTSRNFHK